MCACGGGTLRSSCETIWRSNSAAHSQGRSQRTPSHSGRHCSTAAPATPATHGTKVVRVPSRRWRCVCVCVGVGVRVCSACACVRRVACGVRRARMRASACLRASAHTGSVGERQGHHVAWPSCLSAPVRKMAMSRCTRRSTPGCSTLTATSRPATTHRFARGGFSAPPPFSSRRGPQAALKRSYRGDSVTRD